MQCGVLAYPPRVERQAIRAPVMAVLWPEKETEKASTLGLTYGT